MKPERRLVLISHRPLTSGGTMRWRQFAEELPQFGWTVIPVTPPPSLTGDQASSDPRVARWSEERARITGRIGDWARPAVGRLGFQPEAFPPNLLWSISGRRAVVHAMRRHRPHAVVATSPPPAALFAAILALDSTPPLVADLRDPWAGNPYYDNGGRLLTRLEHRALARARSIVAVTEPMLEQLRDRHPDLSDRMRLLPNGYHPRLLAMRSPDPPDWSRRKATLIYTGTLYGERSLADLVSALGRPELAHRARLEIVGNVNPTTEQAIASAPPELEVSVTPPQAWEATMARVRAADIAVVVQPASTGDAIAWPAKTFEALALGKPILSVTSGGAVEGLLTTLGQDAGCARVGDVESITSALGRLLASPPPPLAVERIEGWNRHRVANDYAALLHELVSSDAQSESSGRLIR
jgi:glycosyltransferase involved in cell wall biosynthesis